MFYSLKHAGCTSLKPAPHLLLKGTRLLFFKHFTPEQFIPVKFVAGHAVRNKDLATALPIPQNKLFS